jgi:hypothetical protein
MIQNLPAGSHRQQVQIGGKVVLVVVVKPWPHARSVRRQARLRSRDALRISAPLRLH